MSLPLLSLPSLSLPFRRLARVRSPIILCIAILLSLWCLLGCGSPPTAKAAKATTTTVESTISSVNSGTVKAEQVAELSFGAMGRVSKLNVKLGDSVEKGSILAELENSDMKISLETAEKELKRELSLLASRGMSQSDIDRAAQAVEVARSQYERSLIRAPFSGLIAEVNLEAGQLSQTTTLTPTAPIRIVDTAPRYIEAEIDEVDLSKVSDGLPARIKILAVRREPFRGTVRKVVQYISSIREQDRTSEIELSIDSEGLLLPAGASADVEIVTEKKDNVLAVPARTVLGRGEDRYVFKYEGGRARRTAVKLGLFNYDRAEIMSGLYPGDAVLFPTEGIEVSDGIKVNTEEISWP